MENESGGGLFSGLFGILVLVSCVLVLTDAAALVFSFWTIMLIGAVALYLIVLPFKILIGGLEALANAFRR